MTEAAGATPEPTQRAVFYDRTKWRLFETRLTAAEIASFRQAAQSGTAVAVPVLSRRAQIASIAESPAMHGYPPFFEVGVCL